MNVCSYHLQEAGATPVQELSFALATAVAKPRELPAFLAFPNPVIPIPRTIPARATATINSIKLKPRLSIALNFRTSCRVLRVRLYAKLHSHTSHIIGYILLECMYESKIDMWNRTGIEKRLISSWGSAVAFESDFGGFTTAGIPNGFMNQL